MHRSAEESPSALGVAVAIGTGALFAFAQAVAGGEPRVGQPGKDVMWVSTEPGLVERMLDMAELTNKDFLVDLGSGDGVVVIAAAKRGAHALGVEYDAELVQLSRRRATEAGVGERAKFVKADLFEYDFSAASVITMYLTEGLNLRLRPRLLALKPGTRVVSQPFLLGDWVPDDSVTVTSLRSLLAPLTGSTNHCFFRCSAYLWVVPARVSGRWRTQDGVLTLRQSFQRFTGELHTGNGTTPIASAKLSGNRIGFNVRGKSYSGRVDGGLIAGTASGNGVSGPWEARLLP